MILADTSVWIDHRRKGDPRLAELLLRQQIVMHTMVLGELACGSLKGREQVLQLWHRLPRLEAVSDETAMQYLEHHTLMSRGIGFVDVHLLAAVAGHQGARLWTNDKRLADIAQELGLCFQPP
jgi:predicted nucleic acid-binding protein